MERAPRENPSLHLYSPEEAERYERNLKTIKEFPKPGLRLKELDADSFAKVVAQEGELERLHGVRWATSVMRKENLDEIDTVAETTFRYIFDKTREDQLNMQYFQESPRPESLNEEARIQASYQKVMNDYQTHMELYRLALDGFKNLVDVYQARYEKDESQKDALENLSAHYEVFKAQFGAIEADWNKRVEANARQVQLHREIFYAVKGLHTEKEIADPSKLKLEKVVVNRKEYLVPEQVQKDFERIGAATVEIGGRTILEQPKSDKTVEKKTEVRPPSPRGPQFDLQRMYLAAKGIVDTDHPLSEERTLEILGVLTAQTFIATVAGFARNQYGGAPKPGEMPPFNLVQIPESASYTMSVEGDQLIITKGIHFNLIKNSDVDEMADVGYAEGLQAAKDRVKTLVEIRIPLSVVQDPDPHALQNLTEDQLQVRYKISRSVV